MRKLVRSGLGALFMKGGGAAIGFLASVIIGRQLGADEIGVYYLSLSLITIPLTLSIFGMNITILKEISRYYISNKWEAINNIFFQTTISVLLISSSFSILLFLMADYIGKEFFSNDRLVDVLRLISISIIPVSIFNLHGHAIQATKKILRAMFLMGGVHNLLVVVLLLIFYVDNAKKMAMLYMISAFITMFVGVVLWFSDHSSSIRFNFKRENLVKRSTPTLVSQLLGQAYTQVVVILLGVWSTPLAVGYFVVSLKIAMLISFVLMSVNRVVAPDFSGLYSRGEHTELRKLVAASSRFMLVISIPFVILIQAFPSMILNIYGEGFAEAANCLRILALGQLIYVITGNVNILLQMTGNETVVRDSSIVGAALTLFLGVILIPIWGLHGASFTTLISLSVANFISCYRANYILKINTLKIW